MEFKEWKKYKLEDLCSKITSGGTPNTQKKEYYNGDIPWLKTQEITFNRIHNTEVKISELGLKNSSAKWIPKNSVIIAMYGATAGRVAINKIPLTTNQACCNLIIDDSLADYNFIYYNLFARFNEIAGMAVGGAQQNLSAGMMKELDILLPNFETQTRIAAILTSIDDKIDLNRQTNATLEALAQTLFKEMCLPKNGGDTEGWREGKIGDVCRNIRKIAHPKDLEIDTVYVGLEHITRKSLCLNEYGISSDVSSQKSMFKAFDILFGKLRPYFHKVCIAPTKGICSTDILVIEPLKADYFSFCLNHLYSDELIKYVSSIADGTRMPRVDWKSISDYEIAIPPLETIKKINLICFPFYQRMIANSQETQTLTTLRDSLLPKLMKGEIAIPAE